MNRTPDNSPDARRGFTLIELMVSIALVLILILGINQVFRIASDTVNAGQALSAADRENRGVQNVLYGDIQNMVTTGAPCIIIRSQQQYAFRNRQDELADRDFNTGGPVQTDSTAGQQAISTIDLDADNNEGEAPVRGERIPRSATNSRSHRLDEFMFFATHLFQRQTGSGGRLSGLGSSKEAFIYYGHLRLAKNNARVPADPADYFNPGESKSGSTNDNNRYATQWTLGRVPILLAGDNPAGTPPDPRVTFIPRNPGNLSPLAVNSGTSTIDLQKFTCDVAQTSIASYREILADPNNSRGGILWWDTVAGARFWADLYPRRPITADTMARTIPVFVQGCTQFTVEYAGDFLAQVQTPGTTQGRITGHVFTGPGATGDGVTDFVVVNMPGPGGPVPVRRTRWYGFPRNVDTSDDGQTGPAMIRGGGNDPNLLIDVVPLRDVIQTFDASVPTIEPDIDRLLPSQNNYAAPGAMGPAHRYVAAWGPGDLSQNGAKRPTMIRITMVVDDPGGRMSEGQSYEYVFELP